MHALKPGALPRGSLEPPLHEKIVSGNPPKNQNESEAAQ